MSEDTRISKEAAWEKTASWDDVRAKGQAILTYGGVEIYRDDAQEVGAYVMSGVVEGLFPVTDGGPYEVILSKRSWENSDNVGGWVQAFLCGCKWGSFHSGSPGHGGRWSGRLCSHAYATLLAANMRARNEFMNDRTAALAVNKDNFYEGTRAVWYECNAPSREPDFVSDSGSMYWHYPEGVVRGADHWGSDIGDCDWRIAGDSDHISSWFDNNGERYAFCPWGVFEPNPDSSNDDWREEQIDIDGELVVECFKDVGDFRLRVHVNYGGDSDRRYKVILGNDVLFEGECGDEEDGMALIDELYGDVVKSAGAEYGRSAYDDGYYGVVYDDATFEVFDPDGYVLFDDEGEAYDSPDDAWIDMDEFAGMWGIRSSSRKTAYDAITVDKFVERALDIKDNQFAVWRSLNDIRADEDLLNCINQFAMTSDDWAEGTRRVWEEISMTASRGTRKTAEGDIQIGDFVDYFYDDFYNGELDVYKGTYEVIDMQGASWRDSDGAYSSDSKFTLKDPETGKEFSVTPGGRVTIEKHAMRRCAWHDGFDVGVYEQDYLDSWTGEVYDTGEWTLYQNGEMMDWGAEGDLAAAQAACDAMHEEEFMGQLSIRGSKTASPYIYVGHGADGYTLEVMDDTTFMHTDKVIVSESDLPKGVGFGDSFDVSEETLRQYGVELDGSEPDPLALADILRYECDWRGASRKTAQDVEDIAIGDMFNYDLSGNPDKYWEVVDVDYDSGVCLVRSHDGEEEWWEIEELLADLEYENTFRVGIKTAYGMGDYDSSSSWRCSEPGYEGSYGLDDMRDMYDSDVDHDEYPDFDGWVWDMERSGFMSRMAKKAGLDGVWVEDGADCMYRDYGMGINGMVLFLGNDDIVYCWNLYQSATGYVFAEGMCNSFDDGMALCDMAAQREYDSTPLGYDPQSGQFFDSPLEEFILTSSRKVAQVDELTTEMAARDMLNFIKQNDLQPNDYPSDYDIVFDYAEELVSIYGVPSEDADWWVDEVADEAMFQMQHGASRHVAYESGDVVFRGSVDAIEKGIGRHMEDCSLFVDYGTQGGIYNDMFGDGDMFCARITGHTIEGRWKEGYGIATTVETAVEMACGDASLEIVSPLPFLASRHVAYSHKTALRDCVDWNREEFDEYDDYQWWYGTAENGSECAVGIDWNSHDLELECYYDGILVDSVPSRFDSDGIELQNLDEAKERVNVYAFEDIEGVHFDRDYWGRPIVGSRKTAQGVDWSGVVFPSRSRLIELYEHSDIYGTDSDNIDSFIDFLFGEDYIGPAATVRITELYEHAYSNYGTSAENVYDFIDFLYGEDYIDASRKTAVHDVSFTTQGGSQVAEWDGEVVPETLGEFTDVNLFMDSYEFADGEAEDEGICDEDGEVDPWVLIEWIQDMIDNHRFGARKTAGTFWNPDNVLADALIGGYYCALLDHGDSVAVAFEGVDEPWVTGLYDVADFTAHIGDLYTDYSAGIKVDGDDVREIRLWVKDTMHEVGRATYASRKTAQEEYEFDVYNTLEGWDGWAEIYENSDGVWGWEVSKYTGGNTGEYYDSEFMFDTPDEAIDDLLGDKYVEAGRKSADYITDHDGWKIDDKGYGFTRYVCTDFAPALAYIWAGEPDMNWNPTHWMVWFEGMSASEFHLDFDNEEDAFEYAESVIEENFDDTFASRKTASKKTATRQFTYAEQKELEDEIEGTELHNADRFKDGGAAYYGSL